MAVTTTPVFVINEFAASMTFEHATVEDLSRSRSANSIRLKVIREFQFIEREQAMDRSEYILVSLTPWRCFFLNIGVIDLHFSTHKQFGLKCKFTQFSMNLVANVTGKKRWPSWI